MNRVVRLADDFASALIGGGSGGSGSGGGAGSDGFSHKVAYIALVTSILLPPEQDEVPHKYRQAFVEYLVHSRAIQSVIHFMFSAISAAEAKATTQPLSNSLGYLHNSFQFLAAVTEFHKFERQPLTPPHPR